MTVQAAAGTRVAEILGSANQSSFLCRRRVMNGLTPEQAALAHQGKILPELRKKSPVYYWQTTRQDTARHEAVCEKSGQWHVLTFGSHGRYSYLANRKCYWPDPKPNPAMRLKRHGVHVVDSCTNASLTSLSPEWARAHNITFDSRGAGYWRWKPHLILQHLEKVADGDVVVWLDYDLILAHDLSALFCLGQNAEQGVALFHFPCHVERYWTKRELADAMGATAAMLDSVQVYGGLMALRRTPATLDFVREWLRWTLEGSWVTDAHAPARQHPHFIQHRHDQSILSLLAKRRGIKTFPFPTRAHDVRDVWAWDAGYCAPGFVWPLPSHRPNNYYGYITHYLEMGHQYKAMLACETVQHAGTSPVPLPDYLESAEVLQQLRDERTLTRAQRRGKWTPESVMRDMPRRPLRPLQRGEVPKALVPHVRCLANVTYGAFFFDGADHVWTNAGCRGAFRCAGLDVYCGRMGLAGKSLVVCRCTLVNTVEAIRHWNDGALS